MKNRKETLKILEELMRSHQPAKQENQLKYYLEHLAETGRVGKSYFKLRECHRSSGLYSVFSCNN